jgi:hypothetical protein
MDIYGTDQVKIILLSYSYKITLIYILFLLIKINFTHILSLSVKING